MTHTLRTLLIALALGCSAPQTPTGTVLDPVDPAEPDPDPRRSVDTTGGDLTFGVRVELDAETQNSRMVGVLRGMNGEEQVTDLGQWQGELTMVDHDEGEFGRLRLEGPEPHDFVIVPTTDGHLDVLMDGERYHLIEVTGNVSASEPLILVPLE